MNVSCMAAHLDRQVSGNEFSGLVGRTRPVADDRLLEKQTFADVAEWPRVANQRLRSTVASRPRKRSSFVSEKNDQPLEAHSVDEVSPKFNSSVAGLVLAEAMRRGPERSRHGGQLWTRAFQCVAQIASHLSTPASMTGQAAARP